MKNLIIICFPVAALIGFPGCNQSSNNSTQTPVAPAAQPASSQQSVSLDGLSAKDLLQAKYDSAILHCDLSFSLQYMDKGTGESQTGTASIDWDLLKNYADQKNFILNAKSLNTDLIVDLKIESIEVAWSEGVQTADATYNLQNTPVLKGSYAVRSSAPIGLEGMTSIPSAKGPVEIFEGVPATLQNSDDSAKASDGSFSDDYKIQFNCLFNTKLKPAYADQFSKS